MKDGEPALQKVAPDATKPQLENPITRTTSEAGDQGGGGDKNVKICEEPHDCYLADLLSQLTSVMAAKPLQKTTIQEGTAIYCYNCHPLNLFHLWSLNFQMRLKILLPPPCSGSANGLIILTNTV